MNEGLGAVTIPLLEWTWNDRLFLVLAGALVASALFVVLSRDIIRSGLALIASFASLAGIYVLLGAPLVAGAQVLVYIGAVAVLLLFAIMLTQTKLGPVRLVFHRQAWAAAVAAIALAAMLGAVVAATAWPGAGDAAQHTATEAVARLLLDQYVLPLEVVSVLLLAAVVGGVFLARREDIARPEDVRRLEGAARAEGAARPEEAARPRDVAAKEADG
jgi:NADH-quinone oxidoreductase subunit J